jgi:hypothetical protein
MRALLRPLTLAVAVGAALATAGSANAVTCAGSEKTAIVCVQVNKGAVPRVNPTGSSYDDCIYVGAPPCTPVSVPLPTYTPGNGELVTVSCGGVLYCS